MRKYIILLSVAFMLGIVSFILFFTNPGLKFILSSASKIIPGKLAIQTIEGNFASPILLRNVSYHNDTINFKAAYLYINWKFKLRSIIINEIKTDHAQLIVNPSSYNSDEEFNIDNYQWLKHIKINFISIKYSQIRYKNINMIIDEAMIQLDQHGYYQTTVNSNLVLLTGSTWIEWEEQLNWNTQFNIKQLNLAYINSEMTSNINLFLQSQGGLNKKNKNIQFNLNQIEGELRNSKLAGSVNLHVNNKKYLINQFKVKVDDASLNLQGDINNKNPDFQFSLSVPQFNKIIPHLFGSVYFNGNVKMQEKFPKLQVLLQAKNIKYQSISINSLMANINSNLSEKTLNLAAKLNQFAYSDNKIKAINMTLNSRKSKQALVSKYNIDLGNQNKLYGTIVNEDIANLFKKDSQISGDINIALNRINALIQAKQIEIINGPLLGKINISGTSSSPKFDGNVSIRNGVVVLPKLRLTLRSVSLNSTINNTSISIAGSAISGNGNVNLRSQFSYPIRFPITADVRGQNFLVYNLEDYKITASPTLKITLNNNFTEVNGSIFFPIVKITPEKYVQVITLPSEVYVINNDSDTVNTNFLSDLVMNIKISLGKDILVESKGLHANISGDLTVSKMIGGLPTATGTLFINRGSYQVYNQLLRIYRGRLIYIGNLLANPGLNIRAIKPLQNVDFESMGYEDVSSNSSRTYVGASVLGTLDNPQIRLISNPPMNQDEILSYMLLGQSAGDIGSMGGLAFLSSAATSMNIFGPNIGDSDSVEGPSSLGTFKVGLLNPSQVLNFRYDLSKHFTIQTEANINETSADLSYVYEDN